MVRPCSISDWPELCSVRNRFEWVSADSEGKSISLVKKIGKKAPLSEQR
jgi:hypothetical protein